MYFNVGADGSGATIIRVEGGGARNPLSAESLDKKEIDPGILRAPVHLAMRGIDVVIHAAAHMLADGDLAGGLRNLWDIHCLCMEFSDAQADFFLSLAEQASSYNLSGPVMRALRLTNQIFGTPLVAYNSPARISYNEHWTDQLFRRRILSCDIWGRDRHKLTGLGFYLRSHLLRMPPKMLARHLFTKWRKGHRPI